MDTSAMIHVLPADDHQLCQQAIHLLLSDYAAITICGTAFTGAELLEQLPVLSPDVVIMDIHMPVIDGIQATRQARLLYPQLKILAYTIAGEEDRIVEIMGAGANGFVFKAAAGNSLIPGILAVMEGHTYYCNSASAILTDTLKRQARTHAAAALFTDTEKIMLRLISRGYTTEKIATTLFMSIKTVEKYRSALLAKADVKNVAELMAYTYKNGLCLPEDDGEI
ncbi:response regulator transcription factor [Niabella sp.]|uniref:response regulator n=1 Tax=Niabella sp. TaxID=1962976 RepID=UPI0026321681|nr:response regulator transcription factor [Niabella sp.]